MEVIISVCYGDEYDDCLCTNMTERKYFDDRMNAWMNGINIGRVTTVCPKTIYYRGSDFSLLINPLLFTHHSQLTVRSSNERGLRAGINLFCHDFLRERRSRSRSRSRSRHRGRSSSRSRSRSRSPRKSASRSPRQSRSASPRRSASQSPRRSRSRSASRSRSRSRSPSKSKSRSRSKSASRSPSPQKEDMDEN